jgi:hypothetical protein
VKLVLEASPDALNLRPTAVGFAALNTNPSVKPRDAFDLAERRIAAIALAGSFRALTDELDDVLVHSVTEPRTA